MFADNVFDRVGTHQPFKIFFEFLQILIDTAAVSQSSGHRELGIGRGDDDGILEDLAAPLTDGR